MKRILGVRSTKEDDKIVYIIDAHGKQLTVTKKELTDIKECIERVEARDGGTGHTSISL